MPRVAPCLRLTSLVAVLVWSPPAWASDDGSRAGGEGTATGGRATAEVQQQPVPTPAAGGGGGPVCSVTPVNELPRAPEAASSVPIGGSAQGYWALQECGSEVDVFWVSTAARPGVSPRVLAQRAVSEIATPTCAIRTSPSSDVAVVKLATWLWLDCPWQPVAATAEVPGLSATVTAAPGEVIWDTGEGEQLTCKGPGVAWNQALAAEDQATYCSHAYRRSSSGEPEQAFTLTATVSWSVSWSASNGEGGTLPTVSRSSSVPIRVGEVQAIATQ